MNNNCRIVFFLLFFLSLFQRIFHLARFSFIFGWEDDVSIIVWRIQSRTKGSLDRRNLMQLGRLAVKTGKVLGAFNSELPCRSNFPCLDNTTKSLCLNLPTTVKQPQHPLNL